ncbi:hypothetical protein ES705_48615 [subsurface metagenome]
MGRLVLTIVFPVSNTLDDHLHQPLTPGSHNNIPSVLIKYHHFLYVLLLIILLSSCSVISNKTDMPEAKQGILDLKNWDLEEKGIVNLNGEWEFYWEKLLKPDDFTAKSIPEMNGFIEVPRIWNRYEVKNEAGTGKRILGGDGFATYRLTIILNDRNISPVSGECIGLKIPYMSTSYRMWINGKLISSNGKVGMEKSETIPQYLPHAEFF